MFLIPVSLKCYSDKIAAKENLEIHHGLREPHLCIDPSSTAELVVFTAMLTHSLTASHAHSLIALLKENCHDDQRFCVLIVMVYYPITSKKQYKKQFRRVIEFFS